MNITVKWQDTNGDWKDFDVSDLLHHSKDHAINLFQQGTPVVAKQGSQYITNKSDLLDQYRQKGKRVMLFSQLTPSSEPFKGFV